jgi:tetratricopeptide (TPR) repeat protein
MEQVPLSTRTLVAAKSIAAYLGKIIFPEQLIPFYPYPKSASLYSLEYLAALVLVTGFTVACVIRAKKQKLWLSAWGYYVVTLLPVLGIVQVGSQAMSDRYTYLPSLAPFLVIGLVVAVVTVGGLTTQTRSLPSKLAAAAAAVILIVVLPFLTVKQIGIWKNNFTLWNYVIENTSIEVPFAYNNRGSELLARGMLDEAAADFTKAIALSPAAYKAYGNLGIVHQKMGQPDRAIEDFNKAIALNPNFSEAYFNRGLAYSGAGLYEKSIESFDKALEINSNDVEAYVERGISLAHTGRYEKALGDFNKAILLDQESPTAYLMRKPSSHAGQ